MMWPRAREPVQRRHGLGTLCRLTKPTYAGAKEYYATLFGPSGSDISLTYRSFTATGSYSFSAGYSSSTYDPGSSAYFYGEKFAETTQSAQSGTYEREGSFGYSHTVSTFGESYFDGSYRGSYTVTDTTTYQGHVVPDESSSYSLRVYQTRTATRPTRRNTAR